MNKIFKVIWNKTKCCYVVASEVAKANGRCKSSNRRRRFSHAALAATIFSSAAVVSLPTEMSQASGNNYISNRHGSITTYYYLNGNNGEPSIQDFKTVMPPDKVFQDGDGWKHFVALNPQGNDGDSTEGLDSDVSEVGTQSVAIGFKTKAIADYAIALGTNSQSVGQQGIAIGDSVVANNDNTVGIGTAADAYGRGSVAIGELASTKTREPLAGTMTGGGDLTQYATAIGANSMVGQKYGVALGSYSKVDTQDSLSAGLNFGSFNANDKNVFTPSGTVSIGTAARQYLDLRDDNMDHDHNLAVESTTRKDTGYNTADDEYEGYAHVRVIPEITRRIKHLAAGVDSTDAVNVAQLQSLANNRIVLEDGQHGQTTGVTLGDANPNHSGKIVLKFVGKDGLETTVTGDGTVNIGLSENLAKTFNKGIGGKDGGSTRNFTTDRGDVSATGINPITIQGGYNQDDNPQYWKDQYKKNLGLTSNTIPDNKQDAFYQEGLSKGNIAVYKDKSNSSDNSTMHIELARNLQHLDSIRIGEKTLAESQADGDNGSAVDEKSKIILEGQDSSITAKYMYAGTEDNRVAFNTKAAELNHKYDKVTPNDVQGSLVAGVIDPTTQREKGYVFTNNVVATDVSASTMITGNEGLGNNDLNHSTATKFAGSAYGSLFAGKADDSGNFIMTSKLDKNGLVTNRVVIGPTTGRLAQDNELISPNAIVLEQAVALHSDDQNHVQGKSYREISGLTNTKFDPTAANFDKFDKSTKAATEAQLKQSYQILNDQLTQIDKNGRNAKRSFTADDSKTLQTTLDTAVGVKGADSNIKTSIAGNNIDVKLAADLKGLNSVETKKVTATTVNATTVNGDTVNATKVKATTIDGDTVNATTVKGDTFNGKTVNATNATINNITVPSKDGNNIVINKTGINNGGKTITNVADGTHEHDVATVGQVTRTVQTTINNLKGENSRNFSTDNGNVNAKLGDTVAVNGGTNIKTAGSGKTITVNLSDKLTGLKSVTADTINGTTVNASTVKADKIGAKAIETADIQSNTATVNKLTVPGADGKNVVISSTGIDNGGKKITNLAEGTSDTDAVTVGQLNKEIIKTSTKNSNDTDKKIKAAKRTFTADDKKTLQATLDTAVGVKGADSNIQTSIDGNNIDVKLASDLKGLNSVTANTVHAGTVAANAVNTNAITVAGPKNGKAMSIGNGTITGLSNTTWTDGYKTDDASRAATEGELHDLNKIISDTKTAVSGGWTVQAGESTNLASSKVDGKHNTLSFESGDQVAFNLDTSKNVVTASVKDGANINLGENSTVKVSNKKRDIVNDGDTHVATGSDIYKAVQKEHTKVTGEIKSAKRTFTADDNKTLQTTLDTAVGVKGADANIQTSIDGNNIDVKLAADLKGLNSVETKTVKATTVNATTVNGDTVNATTVKATKVEGDTINGKTVNANNATINNITVPGDDGNNIVINKTGINNGGKTITNVADGTHEHDVATVGQVNKTIKNLKGENSRNFSTDNGTVNAKLGDTVAVNGGANIKTAGSGKTITVNLSDTLTGLKSVNADNIGAKAIKTNDIQSKTATVNTLTVPVADGKNVVISSTGIDNGGKKITNLAEGTNDSDAVTVGQLNKEIIKTSTKNSNDTDKKIKNAKRTFTADDNKTLQATLGTAVGVKGADSNIQTSIEGDNIAVKLASDLKGLNSVTANTVNAGTVAANEVSAKTITVAAPKNGKAMSLGNGTITGLTNTTWTNGYKTDDVSRAATEGELHDLNTIITDTQTAVKGGWTVKAGESTNLDSSKVDAQHNSLSFVSGDQVAFHLDSSNNTVTAAVKDGATIKLGENSTVKVTDKNRDIVTDGNAQVATGGDIYKAVQKEHTKVTGEIKSAKRTFTADDNKTLQATLDTAVGVKGADSNISTAIKDNNIEVKLASDLTGLNSVTTKTVKATTVNATTVNGDTVNATTVKATKVEGDTINGKTVNANNATINNITVPGDDGNNIVINKTGINNGGKTITNVADGTHEHDVATVGQVNKTIKNLKGENSRNFSTDNGTVNAKLGDTVEVKGGSNIKTAGSDKTITVNLSDTLTGLKSVTADTINGTTVNADNIGAKAIKTDDIQSKTATVNTLTVPGADGKNIVISSTGIDNGGKKITNLAEGTNDSDAVTVGQLNKEIIKTSTKNSNDTDKKIKNAKRTFTADDNKTLQATLGTAVGVKGADSNIQTSIEGDNIAVKLASDLKGLNSVTANTVNAGTVAANEVSAKTITVAAPKNGKAMSLGNGTITGLTNTTWTNGYKTDDVSRAATEGELHDLNTIITDTQTAVNGGWTVKAGESTNLDSSKVDAQHNSLSFVSGDQVAFHLDSSKNAVTASVKDGATINLGENSTVKVTDKNRDIVTDGNAQVATGGDIYKAVQKEHTKVTGEIKSAKRTFTADDNKTLQATLDTAVGVKGADSNISTAIKDNNIEVKLASDLTGLNSVTAKTVNADTVKAKKVSATSVNATTVTGDTINGKTVNADTVNAKKVSATSVNATTVTGDTINGKTVNATTVNAKTVTGDTINGTTVNAKSVNADNATVKTITVPGADGKNIVISKTGIDNGGKVITDLADGTKEHDAATVGQVNRTVQTTINNLKGENSRNFSTDNGTVNAKLGDTVAVNGGANIKTAGSGKAITVSLSDTLTGLQSVTADTINGTTVNASTVKADNIGAKAIKTGDIQSNTATVNTLTVPGADGKNVVISSTGIDNGGKKITNLAEGTADTDAVTVGQLNKEIIKTSTKNSNDTDKKIKNAKRTFTADDNKTLQATLGTAVGVKGADSNIQTSIEGDNIAVKLASDLKGLNSVTANTVNAGTVAANEVSAKTITVAAPKNGKAMSLGNGTITGLTNTTWTNGYKTDDVSRAATEGELHDLNTIINNTQSTVNSGWTVKAGDSTNLTTSKVDSNDNSLSFVSGDQVAFHLDASKNAVTAAVKDGATLNLGENSTVKVTDKNRDIVTDGNAQVATGGDIYKAVQKEHTKVTGEIKSAKRTFTADDNKTLQATLDTAVGVKGADSNISTAIKDNNIEVKLASDLTGLNSVTAKTVNADNVKAKTVNATTVTGDTINGTTVNATTVNAKTVTGDTINGKTVNADTVSAKNVNADNATVKTITVPGADGKNIVISKNGIDNGGKTITDLADGVNDHDAATVGQVSREVKTTINNLKGENTRNFSTDNGSVNATLADTVAVKGGANIKTSGSGKTITVNLSDELTGLKSVSAKSIDAKTVTAETVQATTVTADTLKGKTVDASTVKASTVETNNLGAKEIHTDDIQAKTATVNTLTVPGADGKNIVISSTGIDNGGKKITNLADGTADTDAVTVGQLNKEIIKTSTKNSNDTDKKIKNAKRTFTADDNKTLQATLGTAVGVKGADANIQTSIEGNNIAVKLASDLKGLNSVTANTVNAGTVAANAVSAKTITVAAPTNGKAMSLGNGEITGLTNTTWTDGYKTDDVSRAATEGELHDINTLINNTQNAVNSGWTVKAGESNALSTSKVNAQDNSLSFVSGDQVAFHLDTNKNVVTADVKDGATLKLGENSTVKVTDQNRNIVTEGNAQVATGGDIYKAVKDVHNKVDGEIKTAKRTFTADDNQTLKATLDTAVGVKGADSNISTSIKDNNIEVKLASDLTGLNSVTAKTVNADNVKAKTVNATTVTGDTINGKTVNADTVNAKNVNADNATVKTITVPGADGKNIVISKNGIDNGGKTITDLADGVNDHDAATVGQVSREVKTTINNLKGENTRNFSTDNGSVNATLADTVAVKGGANIKTAGSGKTITVNLSDELTGLKSVSAKSIDAKTVTAETVQATTVTADTLKGKTVEASTVKASTVETNNLGAKEILTDDIKAKTATVNTLTVPVADGKNIVISSTGIDNGGKKITNLADGTADTDAVTVGQLNKEIIKTTKKNSDDTDKKIKNAKRTFTADDNKTLQATLGTAVGVKGADANIKTSISGNDILVQLSPTLSGLRSVTADEINAGGLTAKEITVAAPVNGQALKLGNGEITGLSNTSWTMGHKTDNVSRAATEGELQDLDKAVGKASQDLNAGWNLNLPNAQSINVNPKNNNLALQSSDDTIAISKGQGSSVDLTVKKGATVTLGGGSTITSTTQRHIVKAGDTHIATGSDIFNADRKFTGDDGKVVNPTVGGTLTLTGGESKQASLTSTEDKNIGVIAGDNNELKVLLSKEIKGLRTIDVGDKHSKTRIHISDGKDGKDGITINGKDGMAGLNGKDGLTIKGKDGQAGLNGKDGLTIKGKDGQVGLNGKDGLTIKGKDGSVGLNGKDGLTIKGKDGQAGLNGKDGLTITGKDGSAGLNGKDGLTIKGKDGSVGLNGKDGLTIKGKDGTSIQITSKGIKGGNAYTDFSGDLASSPYGTPKTRVALGEGIALTGGFKAAPVNGKAATNAQALDQLTQGNIAVVNETSGKAHKLEIRLAKNIKGLDGVQVGNAGSGAGSTTLSQGKVTVEGAGTSGTTTVTGATIQSNQNGKSTTISGDQVTVGSTNAKVTIDGSTGTVSMGDGIVADGAHKTITVGGAKGITMSSHEEDGHAVNEIKGLSNTNVPTLSQFEKQNLQSVDMSNTAMVNKAKAAAQAQYQDALNQFAHSNKAATEAQVGRTIQEAHKDVMNKESYYGADNTLFNSGDVHDPMNRNYITRKGNDMLYIKGGATNANGNPYDGPENIKTSADAETGVVSVSLSDKISGLTSVKTKNMYTDSLYIGDRQYNRLSRSLLVGNAHGSQATVEHTDGTEFSNSGISTDSTQGKTTGESKAKAAGESKATPSTSTTHATAPGAVARPALGPVARPALGPVLGGGLTSHEDSSLTSPRARRARRDLGSLFHSFLATPPSSLASSPAPEDLSTTPDGANNDNGPQNDSGVRIDSTGLHGANSYYYYRADNTDEKTALETNFGGVVHIVGHINVPAGQKVSDLVTEGNIGVSIYKEASKDDPTDANLKHTEVVVQLAKNIHGVETMEVNNGDDLAAGGNTDIVTKDSKRVVNGRDLYTALEGLRTFTGDRNSTDKTINTTNNVDVLKMQPKEALAIIGGAKGALTDDNLGTVVETQARDGHRDLAVKLAADLHDMNSIDFQAGGAPSDAKHRTATLINKNGILAPVIQAINGPRIVGATVENGHKVDGGIDMNGGRITNLAPGINPSDAATVSQVQDAESTAVKGSALSAALSGLTEISYDPTQPTQLMGAFGHYKDESAVALGLAHYRNESQMFHGGLAYAGRTNFMWNLGFTYRFGTSKANSAINTRWNSSYSQVQYLQSEVQQMKGDEAQLRKELAAEKAVVAQQNLQNQKLNDKINQIMQMLQAQKKA